MRAWRVLGRGGAWVVGSGVLSIHYVSAVRSDLHSEHNVLCGGVGTAASRTSFGLFYLYRGGYFGGAAT